jgi:hypothetical protein
MLKPVLQSIESGLIKPGYKTHMHFRSKTPQRYYCLPFSRHRHTKVDYPPGNRAVKLPPGSALIAVPPGFIPGVWARLGTASSPGPPG